MAPPWMAWASLLLVAGLTLHHVQRLRTDRHLFRMFRAERQNDWPAAEKEAQAALETDGKAVDPLFVLGQTAFVTVRGYTQDHRLQRVRRTRTFVNMSDADIARKIARRTG